MTMHPDYVRDRTDAYFLKTQKIVERNGDCRATYAVFVRADVVVAANMAVELLRKAYPADSKIPLEIERPVAEGTLLSSGKPLLYISGSMAALSPMETLFLQQIGFACVSAYNALNMCLALPKADFIAMDARHCTGDDMHVLGDYGAAVGSKTARLMGAKGFIGSSTTLGAQMFEADHGIGTMPHALIGYAKARIVERGEDPDVANATLEAAKMYAETFPEEKSITVLVDFDGREITDALAVAKWFRDSAMPEKGKTLGFRLDTHGGRFLEGLDWNESVQTLLKWTHKSSPSEVFKVATHNLGIEDLEGLTADEVKDKCLFGTGVTAANVVRFRKALDDAGFKKAKIVASSGFDTLKCRVFGNLGIPVDVVGTGSFLPSRLSRTYATADIVRYEFPDGNGGWSVHDLVKVGREHLMIG